MSVHSGTIPVERLWASLREMFPQIARSMTLEWFSLLAGLAFLRYNYRRFHHRLLPAWSEQDALLAERIDNLCDAVKALQEEDVPDALANMFAKFELAHV